MSGEKTILTLADILAVRQPKDEIMKYPVDEVQLALYRMEKRNPSRSLKGDVYLCGVNFMTNQKIEHEYTIIPNTYKSEQYFGGN